MAYLVKLQAFLSWSHWYGDIQWISHFVMQAHKDFEENVT
jgi:hypothetical protein